jgi:hypothetical protein
MKRDVLVTVALTLTALSAGLAHGTAPGGATNDIPYVSGGVGLDAREELRAQEGDYNLMMVMVLSDGHYMGGADLRIRDQGGTTLLAIDAQGPWVLARLRAGSYTVEARAGGVRRTARCVIHEKGLRRVVLTWDREPD